MKKRAIPIEEMEDIIELAHQLQLKTSSLVVPPIHDKTHKATVKMAEDIHMSLLVWNLLLVINDEIEIPEGWEPKYGW